MSGFAQINHDLNYWQKQVKPLFPDLTWNIPEQKTGHINIIGGNAQNFSSIIRTAEYLDHNFPLKQITTILPDVLRSKLPPIENLTFTPSTSNGAFAKSYELEKTFLTSDFNFIIGDLSHNAETAIAITDAIKTSEVPLLITRDAIDLLAPTFGQIITKPQLHLVCSMSQLQKIFRALYYPRMIMLSQPLIPTIETLHKFTLTYDATILTFHQENIIVANRGNVITTKITDTDYSPISLWSGQLASKIIALNLFNPHKSLEATAAAILYQQSSQSRSF